MPGSFCHTPTPSGGNRVGLKEGDNRSCRPREWVRTAYCDNSATDIDLLCSTPGVIYHPVKLGFGWPSNPLFYPSKSKRETNNGQECQKKAVLIPFCHGPKIMLNNLV